MEKTTQVSTDHTDTLWIHIVIRAECRRLEKATRVKDGAGSWSASSKNPQILQKQVKTGLCFKYA